MATITISWRDPTIPLDTPIAPAAILETDVFRRAVRHLAIEWGAKAARRAAFALVHRIKLLAIAAEKSGQVINISTTNQSHAPQAWDTHFGLGVEIRGIVGNTIMWDVRLTVRSRDYAHWSLIYYLDGICRHDIAWRAWPKRADAAVRRLTSLGFIRSTAGA